MFRFIVFMYIWSRTGSLLCGDDELASYWACSIALASLGYRTFQSVDLLRITAEEGPQNETFCIPVKLMLCYKLNILPVYVHMVCVSCYPCTFRFSWMRRIMLIHVPEARHLDTPFHSAAKMGSAQIIGVHSWLYLCVVLLCLIVLDMS